MQENPNNLSNIAIKVKKMVIFLGILLFFGIALLIISLVLKSNNSPSNNADNTSINNASNLQNISLFPKNCSPISIVYKENYIALTSKNCALIKIISPSGKINSYHY